MDDLTQREFLAELEELTEQLFAITVDLRLEEASGPLQREILARAFRCLHSIKGIASSAGFIAVAELAHQAENVLDRARSGRIEISNAFVDTLEDVANAIAESVGEVSSGKSERATDLVGQRLSALAAGAASTRTTTPTPDLPAGLADFLNEREKQLVLEALRQKANVCLINATFEIAVFDTEFQQLRDTLARYGEVVCTLPSAAGPAPDRIGFRIFYTSEFTAPEIQTRLLAAAPAATVTDLSHTVPADPELAEQPQAASVVGVRAASAPSDFVRVELDELDRVSAAAHSAFEQIVAALDLVATSLSGVARTELGKLDVQVRQSLNALEEKILELRTISVNRVLQRALLAGRVAARSGGKEVDFSISGSDLRIDKEVCDAIATPLLHLIRNAVDHGIEGPAERTTAGKKRSGAVRIEAWVSGGYATFVVADDGRGIDPQVISLVAATRGLIEKEMVLDMDQSLRMIFLPGFSTAAIVSSLSGRGVGLDVVDHSVRQVGGSVNVRSWPGKGSEFELRLPRNRSKI